MHTSQPSPPAQTARSLRLAWLLSFAITLAVIIALLLAKAAQAAEIGTGGGLLSPLASISIVDDEGEEDEEEDDGEEGELEEEEGEELEEEEAILEPPAECGLRTARASVVAYASQSKVRTQISYTSFAPVRVAVGFRLHGGKGSLTLGRERRRLSYAGVVHGSARLGKSQLAKVLAARDFTVTVRVLDAPGYCKRYFDRHLKSRRSSGDRITWLQSDSVFGT
jgi:hypothetical protein